MCSCRSASDLGLVVFRDQKRRYWLFAQGWVEHLCSMDAVHGQAFLNPTSLSEGKAWSLTLPPWETLAGIIRTALVGYRDVPSTWLAWLGVAAR